MVKIEPFEPQLPTKFEFLEYLADSYGWSENVSIDYLYENLHYYYFDEENLTDFVNDNLTSFQSEQLEESIFEEHFNGDWRKGQEIRKVVIAQRLYQISPDSTQA